MCEQCTAYGGVVYKTVHCIPKWSILIQEHVDPPKELEIVVLGEEVATAA
jgi:hypothetical protein